MTYHLSHTDLDGYSCQYLTSKVFEDIKYFNSGYGKQINENLREKMGTAAYKVLLKNTGATERNYSLIKQFLNHISPKLDLFN